MNAEDKKLWAEAAVKGWQVYVDNEAVQILSMQRSSDVKRELAQQGELNKILRPRFVLTDRFPGCCKFGRSSQTGRTDRQPTIATPAF